MPSAPVSVIPLDRTTLIPALTELAVNTSSRIRQESFFMGVLTNTYPRAGFDYVSKTLLAYEYHTFDSPILTAAAYGN